MTSFKVPFGLSIDQSLVAAESAIKGNNYFCPSCDLPLTFRAGEVKAKHFAHRAEAGCSAETVLHAIAKRLVAKVVAEWISGGRAPVLERKCTWGPALQNYECEGNVIQKLPRDRVTGVAIERSLPNLRKPDVLLLLDNTPVLAVEILVTHKVDSIKMNDFEGLPWVELDASAVLERPYVWSPLQMRLRGEVACKTCRILKSKKIEIATSALKKYGLPWPNGYEVEVTECYHCHAEIPFYIWKDFGSRDTDWVELEEQQLSYDALEIWLDRRCPPAAPRPWIVQFRFSKTLKEKHWVNLCPACKWIQPSCQTDW